MLWKGDEEGVDPENSELATAVFDAEFEMRYQELPGANVYLEPVDEGVENLTEYRIVTESVPFGERSTIPGLAKQGDLESVVESGDLPLIYSLQVQNNIVNNAVYRRFDQRMKGQEEERVSAYSHRFTNREDNWVWQDESAIEVNFNSDEQRIMNQAYQEALNDAEERFPPMYAEGPRETLRELISPRMVDYKE